jgi:hypothetical protein
MNSSFTGGSFANPVMQGNTLMSMFAPGPESDLPSASVIDPFTSRYHSRYEVPDTSKVVDLGEVVMFTMQTDDDNFMTQEVLPLISWGRAIRTYKWSVWNFPQLNIPAVPETAPPRFGYFNKISETTSLMRFAVGMHMSAEYAKTPMGRAHQLYNLQQIALSVQAMLSNQSYRALLGAEHQSRKRLEEFGTYTPISVDRANANEVKQWCRPQKEEHGFMQLYEDTLAEMSRIGGKANAVILTTKLNTLVLARPELIEFNRAGPAGPALVRNPNRSLLPNGARAFFTRTYPERFGLDTNLWQKLSQIGNYHKSIEPSKIRSGDPIYMEKYHSGIRNISIYNQESNAMDIIKVSTMMAHSHIFRSDGSLRAFDEPLDQPGGRRDDSMGFTKQEEDEDFLNFEAPLPPAPLTIAEAAAGGSRHPLYGGGGGGGVGPLPRTLEVFGQLRARHFTWTDLRETGSMLAHRFVKACNCEKSTFVCDINKGMELYRKMCKREFDKDFLQFALKSGMKTMYQNANPQLQHRVIVDGSRTLIPTVPAGVQPPPPAATHVGRGGGTRGDVPTALTNIWVDTVAADSEAVLRKVKTSSLRRDPASGSVEVMNITETNGFWPLPLGSEEDFPEVKGMQFHNLTGYASYPGFKAMAAAFESGHPLRTTRYNVVELEQASKMIDALDKLADKAALMLPGCQLFQQASKDKSGGQIIGEQLLGMVGLNVMANLNKVGGFIMSRGDYDKLLDKQANREDFYMGQDDFAQNVLGSDARRADMWSDMVRACVTKYFSASSEKTDINLLSAYSSTLQERLGRSVSDKKFATAYAEATRDALVAGVLARTMNPTNAGGYVPKKLDFYRALSELVNLPTPNDVAALTADETRVAISSLFKGPDNYRSVPDLGDADTSFVPAWSPLKLQIYSTILQLITYAATAFKGSDAQLSNYMKVIATLLSFARADNGGEVAELKNRAGNWVDPAAGGLKWVPWAEALKRLIDNVLFPDHKDEPFMRNLKQHLDMAIAEEQDFASKFQRWDAAGGAPAPFTLPFLSGIFGNRNKSTVTYDSAGTWVGFVALLLNDKNQDFVAQAIGKTYRDSPSDFTAAGQAGIGGRPGLAKGFQKLDFGRKPPRAKKYGDYDGDDDGGDDDDGTDIPLGDDGRAFYKTSLVIPSDQLPSMFGQNDPRSSRTYIDVRVSNPRKPTDYVSYDAQNALLSEMRDLRAEFKAKVVYGSQIPGQNQDYAATLEIPWTHVPLLEVGDRTSHTFFGPSSSEENNQGIAAYGLRIKARFTRSFTLACQSLDRDCMDPMDRICGVMFACTPFTRKACEALITNNVRLPFNMDVFRPHMNYLMELCAVLSTGVNDLGFTAIAGRDYFGGTTVLTKEFNTHLSFWSGTIITQPQNVKMLRNLMSVGFGPGGGTGWYRPGKTYDPRQLGDYRTPRLAHGSSPSLMCVALPFTENTTREYICLGGRLNHLEEGYGGSKVIVGRSNGEEMSLHYSTAPRYCGIWGWKGQPDSGIMETLGESNYALYNTRCYAGMTMYTGISTEKHPNGKTVAMTMNRGHWGPNVGPGCQAVYQGEAVPLPQFDYHIKFADRIIS